MESIVTLSYPQSDQLSSGNRLYFPLSVDSQASNHIFEVEVLSINFAHMQYPINANNNTFYIQELAPTTVLTITIPVGYYTGTTLAAALQTAMDAAATATITVSYSTTTYKFTFSSTSTFRFLDGAAYSTVGYYALRTTLPAWRVLGLDVKTDSSLFSTLKTSHVSSVPADFSGSVYVRLKFTHEIQGQISSSIPSSEVIPLPAFGGFVQYQPEKNVVHLLTGRNLSLLSIELLDDTLAPAGYQIPFDFCIQLSLTMRT